MGACSGTGQVVEVVGGQLAHRGRSSYRYQGGCVVCPVCGSEIGLANGHSVPVDNVPTHADRRIVHLMTGSSTVACGDPMKDWETQPDGWDLGTVTVQAADVTCTACLATFSRSQPGATSSAPGHGYAPGDLCLDCGHARRDHPADTRLSAGSSSRGACVRAIGLARCTCQTFKEHRQPTEAHLEVMLLVAGTAEEQPERAAEILGAALELDPVGRELFCLLWLEELNGHPDLALFGAENALDRLKASDYTTAQHVQAQGLLELRSSL